MNTSKKRLLSASDDADEIMSSDSDEEKFEWTPKSIDIMLNEYKNNMDKLLKPGMPRRRIWDVVRKRLGQEGFQGVRSDMCLKKFGKLKLLYKDFISGRKVHRSFAGHAKIIKEILEKSPQDIRSEDEEKVLSEDMKDCPAWFASFIERYLRDEEERRCLLKKFHDDIVAVETKKCQLLEILVEKVNAAPPSPPVIRVAHSSETATIPSSPPPHLKPKVIATPGTSNGDILKTEAVKRKINEAKFQKMVKKNPTSSSDHNYNNSVSQQTPVPQPSTPKPQQPSLKGLSALFKNNFNHNIQVLPVNESEPPNEAITVHEGVITIQNNEGAQMDVSEEGVNDLPSEIIILNEHEEAPQNVIQAQTDS